MLELVFDANALITCCQATTQDGPVIESVLEVCILRIPIAVHQEVLTARARFPDARLADRIIGEGRIEVIPTSLPSDNVLDHYRLGSGEKDSRGRPTVRYPLRMWSKPCSTGFRAALCLIP